MWCRRSTIISVSGDRCGVGRSTTTDVSSGRCGAGRSTSTHACGSRCGPWRGTTTDASRGRWSAERGTTTGVSGGRCDAERGTTTYVSFATVRSHGRLVSNRGGGERVRESPPLSLGSGVGMPAHSCLSLRSVDGCVCWSMRYQAGHHHRRLLALDRSYGRLVSTLMAMAWLWGCRHGSLAPTPQWPGELVPSTVPYNAGPRQTISTLV